MINLDNITITRALSFWNLKEDIFFNLINNDDYEHYIENAISIGTELAEIYKNTDITDFLKESGYIITIASAPNLTVRAKTVIKDDDKFIIIYKESINEMKNIFKFLNINITHQEIINLHLSHEMFHVLELEHERQFKNVYKKINKKYFRWTVTKTITKTSEISAHQFATIINEIPFHIELIEFYAKILRKEKTIDECEKIIIELYKQYKGAKWT